MDKTGLVKIKKFLYYTNNATKYTAEEQIPKKTNNNSYFFNNPFSGGVFGRGGS